MESEYRFTIFTPCYNSEKFIHRVIESLEAQTYNDFEWLVINDASEDDTLNILQKYADVASFPVRIINNPKNKMLYYNYNLAFEQAKGELMVFAGHDDRFHAESLDTFNSIWEQSSNESTAAIWCECQDQFGNLVGVPFPEQITISDYFEMFPKYIYKQERFACTRTDILRSFKFDLDGERTGEFFLWANIGLKFKTIYINKILRTYYIEDNNPDALTKRSREDIAIKVYISYLDWINLYLERIKRNIVLKLRFHFALAFYGILSDQKPIEVIRSIHKTKSRIIVCLLYPLAYLRSLKK